MRKTGTLIAILAGILLAIVLLAFNLHRGTSKEVLSLFNRHQLMVARLTAAQIESYFNGRSRDARYLSSLKSLQRRDLKALPSELAAYMKRLSRTYVRDILVFDDKGGLVYSTAGAVGGSARTGSDILAWAKMPENRGTVRLIVERVQRQETPAGGKSSLSSYPGLSVVTPVYRETEAGGRPGTGGKFSGIVLLSIDMEKMLMERTLLSVSGKALRNLWIIDGDGVLLLQSEHPDMVSSNVRKLSEGCSRCHGSFNYVEKIVAAKQGSVEYQVRGSSKKVAAFWPVNFGDVSWIVVVNSPYDDVTGFIGRNLRDTLGLLGIVVLVMGVASHFLYKTRRQRIAIQEEVEHLKETQRLSESLRETRDYLENLLDYANAPIIVWNPDSRITRVNHAFERLTGRPAEEILGSSLEDLFPAERREEAMEHIRRTKAGERWETVEIPLLGAAGTERTVLWNSATLFAADGRTVIATIAQGQDITARKEAEKALQASESKYRLLVENASEAIFIVQDEVVKYSNPVTTRITGYSEEELASIPFITFVHPEDRQMVDDLQGRCLKGEDLADTCQLRLRNKAGNELWGELNAALIPWEGRPAILNFVRDITPQKKLESQLLVSQKMDAVGKLAGGVAHDFNNLLTVILGYCEILNARFPEGEAAHREIEAIQKAGTRAKGLTNQLLAFSRRQILRPQVVNINSIVLDMEVMLRRLIEEDIEIVRKLDEGLWNVKADPGQIEQVVMNIAINARDAMPGGGRLTIETSNVVLDENYARRRLSVPPGAYVVVAISDTGVGMDRETASKIFEPFFTTKELGKGTGLGLSTAYGIVKQSGGFIWVYSEPGRGSSFKIYLPRTEERGERSGRETPHFEDLRGEKTVLVAEDDESIRGLAVEFLRPYGYKVLSAENGEDGLRVAAEHEGEIDLLLTDVVMPRMGGKELYERLRPLRPGIKVLFVSGYTDDAIVHHGVLDPGVSYLQKPYTQISLARKVKEVLEADA